MPVCRAGEGFDVARMYPEIVKLVGAFAKRGAKDIDCDDLVQEVWPPHPRPQLVAQRLRPAEKRLSPSTCVDDSHQTSPVIIASRVSARDERTQDPTPDEELEQLIGASEWCVEACEDDEGPVWRPKGTVDEAGARASRRARAPRVGPKRLSAACGEGGTLACIRGTAADRSRDRRRTLHASSGRRAHHGRDGGEGSSGVVWGLHPLPLDASAMGRVTPRSVGLRRRERQSRGSSAASGVGACVEGRAPWTTGTHAAVRRDRFRAKATTQGETHGRCSPSSANRIGERRKSIVGLAQFGANA